MAFKNSVVSLKKNVPPRKKKMHRFPPNSIATLLDSDKIRPHYGIVEQEIPSTYTLLTKDLIKSYVCSVGGFF